MPIVFGSIPNIMTELSSTMPTIALNISMSVSNWQNTMHPLVCFVYVKALRVAFRRMLKSIVPLVNTDWKKTMPKNIVHIS